MSSEDLRLSIRNEAYLDLITTDLLPLADTEQIYKTSSGDVRGQVYIGCTSSGTAVIERVVGTQASVNHESLFISILDSLLYTKFPSRFTDSYKAVSNAVASSIARAIADNIDATGFVDYDLIQDISYSYGINVDYGAGQIWLQFMEDQRLIDHAVQPYYLYQPSSYWKDCPQGPSDPDTNYYLFAFRRTWTYDVVLTIIGWVMTGKILSTSTTTPGAESIVHTLEGYTITTTAGFVMNVNNISYVHAYRAMKAIAEQLYVFNMTTPDPAHPTNPTFHYPGLPTPAGDVTKVILPFSYNTYGDDYCSNLDTTGNNSWVVRALFLYEHFTGDDQHRAVAIIALNKLLDRQVTTVGDNRYGLFKAGYNYVGSIGYWGYGTLTEQGFCAIEHNADMIDTLAIAYKVTGTASYLTVRDMVKTALNKLWILNIPYGNHFCTEMNADGTLNTSVAIDNNTWAASAICKTDEAKAWESILYVYNNFVIKTSSGFYGCKFFDSHFLDPYVPPNPLFDDMVQPEATFGYIHLLIQFADQTTDTTKKYFCRRTASILYNDIVAFSYYVKWNIGVPYASRYIYGLFTTLDSIAGTASGLIVNAEMYYPAYRKLFLGIDV